MAARLIIPTPKYYGLAYAPRRSDIIANKSMLVKNKTAVKNCFKNGRIEIVPAEGINILRSMGFGILVKGCKSLRSARADLDFAIDIVLPDFPEAKLESPSEYFQERFFGKITPGSIFETSLNTFKPTGFFSRGVFKEQKYGGPLLFGILEKSLPSIKTALSGLHRAMEGILQIKEAAELLKQDKSIFLSNEGLFYDNTKPDRSGYILHKGEDSFWATEKGEGHTILSTFEAKTFEEIVKWIEAKDKVNNTGIISLRLIETLLEMKK